MVCSLENKIEHLFENVLNFCLCWGNILTRGFANVFLQESEVTKMDDYKQKIIQMINDVEDINLLEYFHEYIKITIEAEG